ncbi:MAG: efflux RND transporter periplasmic adaptor subunit [Anaerolineae bacterium]|nr:efflux RND transporter periplasmic adaptor subunit [Anaerolineae bacterium]
MKKRRWWLLLLLVLPLILGGGYTYYRLVYTAASTAEGPALETTEVYRGDIVLSVDGLGNLLPAAEVDVGFQTGGLLVALEVAVGDTVQAGDFLARLDTRELELALQMAQLDLEQAQINLDRLRADPEEAALAVAQSNLTQAVINREETQVNQAAAAEQAWLALVQAANNLRDVQADYENIYWQNRQLDQQLGQLPDAQSDAEAEAWRAVENAEAAMAQARVAYEQTLEQSEIAAARARTQVASAQANLDALYVGAAASDLAAAETALERAHLSLEQAQMNLDQAVLRAPVGGTVLAVGAEVGELVSPGTLVTLADLQSPLLRFWVEEGDMEAVQVGNRVVVVFDARPNSTYSGEVVRIDPALVNVSGTPAVQSWATVDLGDHAGQLLSGMAAEVEVIETEVHDVLLVPLQALRELGKDEGQYAVIVVGPGGTLETRVVQVGLRDFVHAEIVSGLEAGEVISLGVPQGGGAAKPDDARNLAPGALDYYGK